MPPLSMLSSAGINIKSPFAKSPNPLSPGRLYRDNMGDTLGENVPSGKPSLDEPDTENQATIKNTSPTRRPITQPTEPTSPISSSRQTTASTSSTEKSSTRSSGGRADTDYDEDAADTSATDSNGFDPDNTCFSTFSAVPNVDMTAFARLGQNVGASSTPGRDLSTPFRSSRSETPGTALASRSSHSPSKAPGKSPIRARDEHTTQLLEFTEQLNYQTTSTSRQTSPTRSRGQDLMAGAGHKLRSPEGRMLNLLDFDLPPAPTPRSIPTISARELETLKAGFQSEISSLKAKLSGAQAEITSLKEAKDDAERRVGTLSEELREANGAKTALQQEKEDWQKHDNERRTALAKLKEEYVAHEEEINRLREEAEEQNKRFQDMENRAGDVEGRLQEAESKLEGYREGATNGDGANPTTPGSNKAVEVAVEKVAKELHALYKTKHEQKVAALKQSYEKRWKKKVDDLAFKVEELEQQNADMRNGRDATPSGETHSASTSRSLQKDDDAAALQTQVLNQETEGLKREIEELNKRMETMSRGVTKLERDNVSLKAELEESRKENSELVVVVDEMLAIDLAAPVTVSTQSRPTSEEISMSTSDPTSIGLKPSTGTSKISGLRGPGFGGYGESRIGGASGLKRSTSGSGPRSGIMSNIERMGRGIGGRGGQE